MFYGLSLGHTPAHMYRAVIESICYGTETSLIPSVRQAFHRTALWFPAARSRAGSGSRPTRMSAMCRLLLQGNRRTMPCSAILGAVAGGVYPDIQTAAESMTTVDYTIEPDQQRHDAYMFYYEKYKDFTHWPKTGCTQSPHTNKIIDRKRRILWH